MLNRKALFNLLKSQPFPGRDSAAWAEGAAISRFQKKNRLRTENKTCTNTSRTQERRARMNGAESPGDHVDRRLPASPGL